MAKLEGSPRRPGGSHGREVTPLPEQRERMAKLEGFLAGRRDRDVA